MRIPLKLHWLGTWFRAVRNIEDGQAERVEVTVVQRGHHETVTMDARTLDVLLDNGSEIRVMLKVAEQELNGPYEPSDVMTPDPDSGIARVMKEMAAR